MQTNIKTSNDLYFSKKSFYKYDNGDYIYEFPNNIKKYNVNNIFPNRTNHTVPYIDDFVYINEKSSRLYYDQSIQVSSDIDNNTLVFNYTEMDSANSFNIGRYSINFIHPLQPIAELLNMDNPGYYRNAGPQFFRLLSSTFKTIPTDKTMFSKTSCDSTTAKKYFGYMISSDLSNYSTLYNFDYPNYRYDTETDLSTLYTEIFGDLWKDENGNYILNNSVDEYVFPSNIKYANKLLSAAYKILDNFKYSYPEFDHNLYDLKIDTNTKNITLRSLLVGNTTSDTGGCIEQTYDRKKITKNIYVDHDYSFIIDPTPDDENYTKVRNYNIPSLITDTFSFKSYKCKTYQHNTETKQVIYKGIFETDYHTIKDYTRYNKKYVTSKPFTLKGFIPNSKIIFFSFYKQNIRYTCDIAKFKSDEFYDNDANEYFKNWGGMKSANWTVDWSEDEVDRIDEINFDNEYKSLNDYKVYVFTHIYTSDDNGEIKNFNIIDNIINYDY